LLSLRSLRDTERAGTFARDIAISHTSFFFWCVESPAGYLWPFERLSSQLKVGYSWFCFAKRGGLSRQLALQAVDMRVVFLHPDLGIGGAERLVVDAAVSLQNLGHEVVIYTSHHSSSHCFRETRDGTLRVVVHGDWLPASVCGRAMVLCAILRNVYCALCLVASVLLHVATLGLCGSKPPDAFFVDQISAAIPVLKLLNVRVLFYCHFPDLLLTQRRSWLKRVYRALPDWLEQTTTGQADGVLVNSFFTAHTFAATFTDLHARGVVPSVLYPAIHCQEHEGHAEQKDLPASTAQIYGMPAEWAVFLSINRFERKKNIKLAILALIELKERTSANAFSGVKLLLAGGYDPRNTENKEYFVELQAACADHGVPSSTFPDDSGTVVFVPSFSDSDKIALLARSLCVLYTPENEHFGIVPVESMYGHRPVIACASGGPLESVRDGETGFLCESDPAEFAEAMQTVLDMSLAARQEMGRVAHQHVLDLFSLHAFGHSLEDFLGELVQSREGQSWAEHAWRSFSLARAAVVATVIATLTYTRGAE
jgi:alpha-1,3/alpha-1,6-mannosyltransferase